MLPHTRIRRDDNRCERLVAFKWTSSPLGAESVTGARHRVVLMEIHPLAPELGV